MCNANEMNKPVADMINGWVASFRGDTEACARWMRDKVRLGGVKQNREMIAKAQAFAAAQ